MSLYTRAGRSPSTRKCRIFQAPSLGGLPAPGARTHNTSMAYRTLCLTLLCASSCRAPAATPGGSEGLGRVHPVVVATTNLGIEDLDGLSGLTRDGDGALWTVPERTRLLLRLGARGVDRRLKIVGIPDELDVEALTWIEQGRFALGTESHVADRREDKVYFVAIGADRATIESTLSVDYATLPIRAVANHGIEGLCFAEGRLLAAVEEPFLSGGQRYGVIVQWSPEHRQSVDLVELTSDVGKLAGLDCRRGSTTTLEVIAIERHFGVRRVLAFELPLDQAATVQSRVISDLNEALDASTNPEGIAWDEHGIALIVDNHYKIRTGPCELLHFDADEDKAP